MRKVIDGCKFCATNVKTGMRPRVGKKVPTGFNTSISADLLYVCGTSFVVLHIMCNFHDFLRVLSLRTVPPLVWWMGFIGAGFASMEPPLLR